MKRIIFSFIVVLYLINLISASSNVDVAVNVVGASNNSSSQIQPEVKDSNTGFYSVKAKDNLNLFFLYPTLVLIMIVLFLVVITMKRRNLSNDSSTPEEILAELSKTKPQFKGVKNSSIKIKNKKSLKRK